ncbi:MAG: GNAT family N-acetyltransferase [Gammaproteobacteria bacterium]
MHFPADRSVYPLNKYVLQNEDFRIKLFSAGRNAKFFANAPYLEEGGVFYNNDLDLNGLNERLSLLLVQYNLNYILLKTRSDIFSSFVSEKSIDSQYYTFLLDTSVGIDKIWSDKLKGKNRNQIRKAEKNKFYVQFGCDELLGDFYKVISECWRDLGTPVHSYELFRMLLEKFKDKAIIIVLYDGVKPISAAFLFVIDGVLSHPFAGTINSYKPSSANNLMYWNIIKYACENNIRQFDMGRSRLGQGTYNFKKSWGGEAKRIYYYYINQSESSVPSYDTTFYKTATTMWKFVPVKIANYLGPKLIYKII